MSVSTMTVGVTISNLRCRTNTAVESIKNAASTAAYGAMSYYHGNESGQIPGAFPTKWWEGSALFMAMLQYQYFTGDQTYNSEVSLGLQWQAGDGDYMPSNYSSYLVSNALNKRKAQ
jgi:mannan endo-1,6-alpha-mannosidase